jgi:hypothetical protein
MQIFGALPETIFVFLKVDFLLTRRIINVMLGDMFGQLLACEALSIMSSRPFLTTDSTCLGAD